MQETQIIVRSSKPKDIRKKQWGIRWLFGGRIVHERKVKGCSERKIHFTCSVNRKWKIRTIEKYCIKHGLKMEIKNGFGERSSDYRRTYFNNHKPDFCNKYICVYCGKLLPRNNVTVDHVIPIKLAQTTLYWQEKLRRRGAVSVNDYQNLVAACEKCNHKKGTNVKGWLIKAKLGQSKTLWFIRYAARLAVIITMILLVQQFCLAII